MYLGVSVNGRPRVSKTCNVGSIPTTPAMKYAFRLTSWRAQMYYCYVLLSKKDHKQYIGYTSDLKKRVKEHFNGKSFATKSRRPLKLIFYESFIDKKDALRREKYFKTNPGKRTLKLMLRDYFKSAK
jgi:putative endonuclease